MGIPRRDFHLPTALLWLAFYRQCTHLLASFLTVSRTLFAMPTVVKSDFAAVLPEIKEKIDKAAFLGTMRNIRNNKLIWVLVSMWCWCLGSDWHQTNWFIAPRLTLTGLSHWVSESLSEWLAHSLCHSHWLSDSVILNWLNRWSIDSQLMNQMIDLTHFIFQSVRVTDCLTWLLTQVSVSVTLTVTVSVTVTTQSTVLLLL